MADKPEDNPSIPIVENGELNARTISDSYVTKKTVGQVLLDFSLLMSNASDMNYVLGIPREKKTFIHYITLVFLLQSVIFQVAVGVLLSCLGYLKVHTKEQRKKRHILNNAIVLLLFFTIIVNAFITALNFNVH